MGVWNNHLSIDLVPAFVFMIKKSK